MEREPLQADRAKKIPFQHASGFVRLHGNQPVKTVSDEVEDLLRDRVIGVLSMISIDRPPHPVGIVRAWRLRYD
jgi:hypothetical protein